MKKKNENYSILAILLQIIQGVIMGIAAVWVPGDDFVKESNFAEFSLAMIAVFLLLFVVIILNVIVHELGHMLCGFKSGYKFISYRVFNIILAKYKDGKKIKRFSIPGTAGQCVLDPPAYEDGKYPYKLYIRGGILGNLLLAVIFTIIGLVATIGNPVGKFMIASALLSLDILLTNGIPLRVAGVANDAFDIKSLAKDEDSKKIFWLSLSYNAKTQLGERPAELKEYLDELGIDDLKLEYDNKLAPSILGMKAAILYDELKFDEAKDMIEDALSHEEMLSLYRNELLCEKLFLEIIGECNKDKIEEIYDDKLKAYMKLTRKFMVSKSRILYAYYKLYEKDNDKANKELVFFAKCSKNYPNLGELYSEMAILDYLRDIKVVETNENSDEKTEEVKDKE